MAAVQNRQRDLLRDAADALHDLFSQSLCRPGFLSHLRFLKAYDEPEILPSSTCRFANIRLSRNPRERDIAVFAFDDFNPAIGGQEHRYRDESHERVRNGVVEEAFAANIKRAIRRVVGP